MPDSKALVIIDLQNDFLSQDGRFPILDSSKESLLVNLTTLVPEFRKQGHVIWVKSNYAPNDSEGTTEHRSQADDGAMSDCSESDIDRVTRVREAYLAGTHRGKTPCCVAGSWNAEFHPTVAGLITEEDTVMIKTYYSAFKETTLLSTLRDKGARNLYFCGLLSIPCVLATLIDAVQIEGFRIHVFRDVLGWRRDKSHQYALKRMGDDLRVNIVNSNEASSPADTNPVLRVPELYYVNGSIPSWRVQIALYEKGIEVNEIRMRVMSHPKPTRLPAFLELNHRGKTPVLIDTDSERTTVNESIAVLSYLETYYPQAPLLPPKDRRKYYARILSLIQETENLHNAYDALEDAFFEARESNTVEKFKKETHAALLDDVYKELTYWEKYASQTAKFIGGGEDFTLADCAFYPILAYMVRRGFEFDERWKGLRRYFEACWERESVKKAQPEGWNGKGKANTFRI